MAFTSLSIKKSSQRFKLLKDLKASGQNEVTASDFALRI